MPDDDEPGFFSARPKVLLLIGVVTAVVLTVALVVARFALPHWAPDIVMVGSPWIGPAFDAAVIHDRGGDFRKRLDDWGDAVVPAMCSALGSRDPKRRRLAAQVLTVKKDPRSVEALIAALADTDPDVLSEVARALSEIGDQRASAPLVAALPRIREYYVAVGVAEEIGKMAHPDLFAQVSVTLLASSQGDMQALGCLALHGSGDPRALAVLDARLGKAVYRKTDMAGWALGLSRQPAALEVIRQALADGDPDRRWGAAIGASMAAAKKPDGSLLDLLLPLTKDPDERIRRAVALVLAAYPQDASITALGEMIAAGGESGRAAANSLGANRSQKAVTMMVSHLSHPEGPIRQRLVRNLCYKSTLLSPSDTEAILRLALDPDPKVVTAVKIGVSSLPLTNEQREALKNIGQ